MLCFRDWIKRGACAVTTWARRDMPDRNEIIEKIKKLLDKTTENGCTEAEMMSALDKAAAMMDAYQISDEDLQIAKDEAVELYTEPPDTQDPHSIKWRLVVAVSKFCGVEIYRKRRETGLRVLGAPADVQWALWLLDHLADFVFGALYEHLIGCCAPPKERRVIMRSFVEACCNHISDRILELVVRSETTRTSNGRELVVIKNAAIKAYMKEHGIHLTSCSGYSPSTSNSAAQAAGRAAGARATFGRPVSGRAGVLRLGKS
jgi:Protein of unknown function (DUF2786)